MLAPWLQNYTYQYGARNPGPAGLPPASESTVAPRHHKALPEGDEEVHNLHQANESRLLDLDY